VIHEQRRTPAVENQVGGVHLVGQIDEKTRRKNEEEKELIQGREEVL
jgi:hypothetical protein